MLASPAKTVLESWTVVMTDAKRIYAESALRSIPRLLSLQDRNPLSPSYGCFHRDYWLYKTSDFPDAVRQFGVHALALAYAHDFSGMQSPYYRNANVRDWAIAGLNFWARIQHADGSFDEFYPFERGWVGPTAFTTYTSSEVLRILRSEMTPEDIIRVETAIRKAAYFVAAGESEEDHLANHHAMALLAVSTAADVLNDPTLSAALPKLWTGFLRYQDPEGWSREYDGADPGYLSATVSFLAKTLTALMRSTGGPARPVPTDYRGPASIVGEIREVLAKAVEFCSYFVYPDGSYAGTIGSRNTLHCYPHGFELLSTEIPLAARIAERMARGLADGKLVPPEIMSDRYVHYRVPEFLLAAIDARPYPAPLPPLPYERPAFVKTFPRAGIAAAVHGSAYTVANLTKGGVVKSTHVRTGEPLLLDTGWVGKLDDGQVVTSQWIDPTHERSANGLLWRVSGNLHRAPSPRLFTVWTHLAFRGSLALLGWYPPAAHWLKGRIRKTLIFGSRTVPCRFTRTLELADDHLTVTDELRNDGRLPFRRLLLGGDIALRYVPQSRFFQSYELRARPHAFGPQELERLNRGEPIRHVRTVGC